jgi:EF-P beta-lysylation protein EpmB
MEKGNNKDPLFLQCVPRSDEELFSKGFCTDPLAEKHSKQSCSVIQKYEGRALLLTSAACCMNCRFCFRRHTVHQQLDLSFSSELHWLQENTTISEVILSGGDPLCLPTKSISSLLQRLEAIDHIHRVRIHTRFPIGIPERLDQELLNCFSTFTKQLIFVVHINHPRELDTDVIQALRSVLKLGIPVLTQTVLLKDINDDTATLQLLFEKIGNSGFIPYYLHQLDRVQGAHHFEVALEKGKRLVKELHKILPGYLLPRYAMEIPKEAGKRIIPF